MATTADVQTKRMDPTRMLSDFSESSPFQRTSALIALFIIVARCHRFIAHIRSRSSRAREHRATIGD
jgi:hypothetical protein